MAGKSLLVETLALLVFALIIRITTRGRMGV